MMKVLIVDDEEMMLLVTSKVLSEKYEVICASSGEEAIRLYDEHKPSLILSDLLMPGMSGFEMHDILQKKHSEKIPVMYMTADDAEDLEGLGLDKGAVDFIRKPFRPDVLLRRIENILGNIEQIQGLKEEASTDKLTGFLNKASVNQTLSEVCLKERGVLLMIDLDSFKLVNDIHGHEMGDEILVQFAKVISSNVRSDDILGRIGGDEFVAFLKEIDEESVVAGISSRINEQLLDKARSLMGQDMSIPLGVSIGGVFVPKDGTLYDELLPKADKALYHVKQKGKHGYSIYGGCNEIPVIEVRSAEEELKKLTMILEERNTSDCAFWLGQDAFSTIYRFMLRFIQSYHGVAYKVLFTVTPVNETVEMATIAKLSQQFGEMLNKSLRKSDIMMQSKPNQFFLFMPELDDKYIKTVIGRILNEWNESDSSESARIEYATELVKADDTEIEDDKRKHL
ncbi:MAG: diguanylate cyclase [Saccharofermentans sp.]|nr:diguanylate cyclase [Saccharofermentans sp.]